MVAKRDQPDKSFNYIFHEQRPRQRPDRPKLTYEQQ